MKRIGFIGTESSHVEHFIRILNVERRHPGIIGAALVGGRTKRNCELAAAGGINVVVEEPADLIGKVDAAIVSSRDGARHLEQARPILQAGLPVFVDKPLAASVTDAASLLRAASEHGALLVSCSALRFVPEVTDLATPDPARGRLRHLHVVGPADPESAYSGLHFYGIHLVEAALEILGNPLVLPGTIDVVTHRQGDTTAASCRIADVHVTLTFITPRGEDRAPFHATAAYTNAVITRDLTLGPDYTAPVLEEFLRTIASGTPRLTPAQLLSPVAILAAVTTDLERQV